MPELSVVNVAVNMSVPSKLLSRPIPVVLKPVLVLPVTVPVQGLAPHEKSTEPALALGTNMETAKRQATARPDLRNILTMVSSPRNPLGRAATEKNPAAWKSNRDAKSLLLTASCAISLKYKQDSESQSFDV